MWQNCETATVYYCRIYVFVHSYFDVLWLQIQVLEILKH